MDNERCTFILMLDDIEEQGKVLSMIARSYYVAG